MKITLHIALLSLFLVFGTQLYAQKKDKKSSVSYKDKLRYERLFIDGGKAKILADYEQAIKLYESCKKIDRNEPAPYYELASLYFHLGSIDEAIKNAEFASEADPQNVYYRILYAEILKGGQRYDLASKEYQEIIKEFPHRFEGYADLALILITQKKYDEAIEIYDKMEISLGPSEEAKLKKQILYLQSGKVEKAASEISQLIEMQPEEVKYYLLLAEVYYVNGVDDKALKAYKKAEEKFPESAEIQLSLADFYRHKKQYKKVFDHLQLAFRSNELEIDAKMKSMLDMFELVNAENKYSEDLKLLGHVLLEAHPEDAKALTINGDIALNMGLKSEAQQYFERAVEKEKGRFPIWNQLLILDAELEQYEKLIEHSQAASEVFPNQPLCYYFLGYGNSMIDRNEQAIKGYESGVNVIVDNDLLLVQFYLGLGDLYNKTQDYKASDEAFEQVLKLDSNNTVALNNYSYYLSLRNENLEKALYFSGRSNKLEPNQPTYLDTYAWILYKMDRYAEALEAIEKAIQHGAGDSGEVLEHKGDILFKLDRKKEAQDVWKKALSLGDGSEHLKNKAVEGVMYE